MFNPFRSEQNVEREAMASNMNPLMQRRMMELLASLLPEEGRPQTFQQAIGQGQFDNPKLGQLLEALRRRHEPAAGGGYGGGSTMAMR